MEKKTRCKYILPTRDSLQLQGYTWAQREEWEKDTPCKWKPKESRESCTYVKIDFNSKAVTQGKEGHCMMIKGLYLYGI